MPSYDFRTAYVQWLQARAAVIDLEFPLENEILSPSEDGDERALNKAVNGVMVAEWRLIQARASCFDDIRKRAQIVQEMFNAAAEFGEPTDNRRLLMLATLVSEICGYQEEANWPTAKAAE
jgi:hypothetical protein